MFCKHCLLHGFKESSYVLMETNYVLSKACLRCTAVVFMIILLTHAFSYS